MSAQTDDATLARAGWNRIAFVVLAGLAFVAGLVLFARPDLHQDSARALVPLGYVIVAGALLLVRRMSLKSVKVGDVEVTLEELAERTANAEKTAQNASTKADSALTAAAGVGKDPREAATVGPDVRAEGDLGDTHKGRFGGQARVGSRLIEADVAPVAGSDEYFEVTLRVRSTKPATEPLRGTVVFHLHETFRQPIVEVPVGRDGVAELKLMAWGAFTVGAVADQGRTRLELDLAELEDASPTFRSR